MNQIFHVGYVFLRNDILTIKFDINLDD